MSISRIKNHPERNKKNVNNNKKTVNNDPFKLKDTITSTMKEYSLESTRSQKNLYTKQVKFLKEEIEYIRKQNSMLIITLFLVSFASLAIFFNTFTTQKSLRINIQNLRKDFDENKIKTKVNDQIVQENKKRINRIEYILTK